MMRLSSGSRIVQPVDDAGDAVSMKLKSAVPALRSPDPSRTQFPSWRYRTGSCIRGQGRQPDDRAQGLADSVMKNSSDKANYNREFQDLQVSSRHELGQVQRRDHVRAVLLERKRRRASSTTCLDNTVSVSSSADGSSGPKVSMAKPCFPF